MLINLKMFSLDYKKRILQDFQANFVRDQITYEELEEKYLTKKIVKPIIKRSLEIDEKVYGEGMDRIFTM